MPFRASSSMAVLKRMDATRQVLARAARTAGSAEAESIRSDARTDADKIRFAIEYARSLDGVSREDRVVLTAGNPSQSGSTDLIRVLRLDGQAAEAIGK